MDEGRLTRCPLAEREGLRKSRPINDIECLAWPIGPIESKGKSGGLSNRHRPPPQIETAAQVDPLNGGKSVSKYVHPRITNSGRCGKPQEQGCELIVLAERVARLVPSHRDPEHFHIEKSEIVDELRRLAREGGR